MAAASVSWVSIVPRALVTMQLLYSIKANLQLAYLQSTSILFEAQPHDLYIAHLITKAARYLEMLHLYRLSAAIGCFLLGSLYGLASALQYGWHTLSST